MNQIKFLVFLLFIGALGSLAGQAVFEDYLFGPVRVNAILQADSLLYLGTDAGLMVKNLNDNSIQHYYAQNSIFAPSKVNSLVKKSNGSVWMGSDNGLYRMQDGVLSRYMASTLAGAITCLLVDDNDYIWLRKSWNLYKINQSETLTEIMQDAPLTMCQGNDGNFWLGYNDELVEWFPDTNEENSFTWENSGLPDDTIDSVQRDSQGNIWILCGLGLTQITPSGAWISHLNDYPHPLFRSVGFTFDDEDRLWIAKPDMLLCFDNGNLSQVTPSQLGIGGFPLNCVYYSDTLYYGARGHIGEYANNSGTVQTLYNTELLPYDIYSIQSNNSSRLWITYGYTSPDYPQQYSVIQSGEATHYPLPTDTNSVLRLLLTDNRNPYGVLYNTIYRVTASGWTNLGYHGWITDFVYNQGKAYFGTEGNGIYIHDGENGYSLDVIYPGSSINYAYRLTADQAGTLWFVNSNNLVSYADSTFTLHPSVNIPYGIFSMTFDAAGNLLIGDGHGTVWLYNGNHCTQYLTLPIEVDILQILPGNHGELWFLTSGKIFVWHELSGVQTLSFGGNSALSLAMLPNDRMLIGTPTGYYIYHYLAPTQLVDDAIPAVTEHSMLDAYPNPCSGNITIQTLSGKELPDLQIYNIRGQLVRELKMQNAGSVIWDGKDASGRDVPNGIYLLSARMDGSTITKKVLVRR